MSLNFRNVTVAESNFPGASAVDFCLRAVTSTLYKSDEKLNMTLRVNIGNLIGSSKEIKHEIKAIRLSAISNTKVDKRLLDRVFTIDMFDVKDVLIMQVFVAFELNESQNMTTHSHVWATLVDEETWKVKHYTYPIPLDNLSWQIAMTK